VSHLQGGTRDRKLVEKLATQFPRDQPLRDDPWQLSSQLKQMTTPWECFRGGKRIDLRPRKQKIIDFYIKMKCYF